MVHLLPMLIRTDLLSHKVQLLGCRQRDLSVTTDGHADIPQRLSRILFLVSAANLGAGTAFHKTHA